MPAVAACKRVLALSRLCAINLFSRQSSIKNGAQGKCPNIFFFFFSPNCLFNFMQLDKEGSQHYLPKKVTLSALAGILSALLPRKEEKKEETCSNNSE